jgi:hypothetical protein
MSAAELIKLVEALGAPYGLERSVKITPGALAADRCLISVGRAAFGSAPADRLIRMGHALRMPPTFAAPIAAALERADVVHFGYEAAGERDIYKIYLEYVTEARRAMAAESSHPVLVHLAYKWVAAQADSGAITRYTWMPCRTRDELEAKLRDLVPAIEAPNALRCALGLVSRVTAFADTGRFLLMEVDEPGNPRRSCDLNVYDAELRMRDISDLLETALTDFAVPKPRARLVFDRAADRALGHLSAGVGRDGQEFVTIYFGVESHSMK